MGNPVQNKKEENRYLKNKVAKKDKKGNDIHDPANLIRTNACSKLCSFHYMKNLKGNHYRNCTCINNIEKNIKKKNLAQAQGKFSVKKKDFFYDETTYEEGEIYEDDDYYYE